MDSNSENDPTAIVSEWISRLKYHGKRDDMFYNYVYTLKQLTLDSWTTRFYDAFNRTYKVPAATANISAPSLMEINAMKLLEIGYTQELVKS